MKFGTDTIAVLHCHFPIRTDSGTAPGVVLSIFDTVFGTQQFIIDAGCLGLGQQLYFVYITAFSIYSPFPILFLNYTKSPNIK
jgi:hypothetical protein